MKLTPADEVTVKFGRVQPVRRGGGKRRARALGTHIFAEKVEDRAILHSISRVGRRVD